MVVEWINLPNKQVLAETSTMTLPTGGNNKADAGDRKSNKLTNKMHRGSMLESR